MIFGFGETIVLHTRTRRTDADGKIVTDDYGNDVFDTADTTLENVPVWPAGATELVQGQDTTITGLFALLPPDTNVEAIDSVTVYGGSFEVDGEPGRYTSPFTGLNPGIEVHLTKVGG